MTDISDVRIGVIGLGNIANLHCRGLAQTGNEDVITAGVDIDESARDRFADTYDVPVYEEASRLFETVDAVLVTTPNKYHEAYVVDALEAGLDVLVEKPLGHTLASAERIASVERESSGFCMIGFHNRFAPPVQALTAYRDRGNLGDVSHVEANYIRRRGIPNRGSWFTQKAVSGGGSLIDLGVHAIDLSLHLLDFPEVSEVSASARTEFGTDEDYAYVKEWGTDLGADGFDVDDSTSAFIRCADGSTISLEVAWATNRPDSKQYYVRGDDGGAGLDLDDETLTLYETTDVGGMHHRTTDVETQSYEPHAQEDIQFLESVAAGERPELNTIDQALTVQRVIDAIYRSSEQNEAVRIESK